MDVSSYVQKILDAARSMGGAVVSETESGCYLGTNVYGTPREGQVTVHKVSWPLQDQPANYHGTWAAYRYVRIGTGPRLGDFLRVVGAAGRPGASEPLAFLRVYEHTPTLQRNGADGRGVVLATFSAPSTVSGDDQRGWPHLVTDAQGYLRVREFA